MIKNFINGLIHFLLYFISQILIVILIPLLIINENKMILEIPNFLYGIILILLFLISSPFIFYLFIRFKYKFEEEKTLIKKWLFGLKHFLINFAIMLLSGLITQIPFMFFAMILMIINFIFKISFPNKIIPIIYIIIFYPIF